MSEGSVVDNDAIIKLCAYSLAKATRDHLVALCNFMSVLGVLKFVVPKQIERAKRITDRESALKDFAEFLAAAEFVEPTSDEVNLAAVFESEAQEKALPLDTGESLCLAVALSRNLSLVVTGDKRAILAVAELRTTGTVPDEICGRIGCFEQLMRALIQSVGHDDIRNRVCNEKNADTAMRMCFACSSSMVDAGTTDEGLLSYINHLRKAAGPVLWKSDALSLVA